LILWRNDSIAAVFSEPQRKIRCISGASDAVVLGAQLLFQLDHILHLRIIRAQINGRKLLGDPLATILGALSFDSLLTRSA
jgi:hypothetical protein